MERLHKINDYLDKAQAYKAEGFKALASQKNSGLLGSILDIASLLGTGVNISNALKKGKLMDLMLEDPKSMPSPSPSLPTPEPLPGNTSDYMFV